MNVQRHLWRKYTGATYGPRGTGADSLTPFGIKLFGPERRASQCLRQRLAAAEHLDEHHEVGTEPFDQELTSDGALGVGDPHERVIEGIEAAGELVEREEVTVRASMVLIRASRSTRARSPGLREPNQEHFAAPSSRSRHRRTRGSSRGRAPWVFFRAPPTATRMRPSNFPPAHAGAWVMSMNSAVGVQQNCQRLRRITVQRLANAPVRGLEYLDTRSAIASASFLEHHPEANIMSSSKLSLHGRFCFQRASCSDRVDPAE